MDQLAFALHVFLVLAIPAGFGWVVLRRLARECDLTLLVPGSFAVGCAALMLLMNELRYCLEMQAALWFAYKILLVLAVLIRLLGGGRVASPRLPRAARGPRAALALGLAGFFGVYFGVPAWQGYLNDAWWGHYPMAVEIQDAARFPLSHPFAVESRLYYHFGPDILAAVYSSLFSWPVQSGYALLITVFGPLAFLLAFALALRLSRNYLCALAAGCFVVAGGNLLFLGAFSARLSDPAARLAVFNSQTIQGLLQMIFTPSHCLGVPLVLLCLALFRTFLARPDGRAAVLLGVLVGALTLVGEWYFFALWAALGVCLTGRAIGRTRRRAAVLAPLAIAAGVALFDNTYTSAMVSYRWLRPPDLSIEAEARRTGDRLEHGRVNSLLTAIVAQTSSITAAPASRVDSSIASSSGTGAVRIEKAAPSTGVMPQAGAAASVSVTPAVPAALPPLPEFLPPPRPPQFRIMPNLVPLSLNLRHFGQVPSWESAGSAGGTWIWVVSPRFLGEFFPILGLGLAFGLWWWRRTRRHFLLAPLLFVALSALPPLVLDWGFRSTDLLRFFTAAVAASGIFAGCLAGRLLQDRRAGMRAAGLALAAAAMANAIGLGILGLIPSTLATAKAASTRGLSLSQITPASAAGATPPPSADDHAAAFTSLANQLGDFLFPLAHGRDRVLVMVSPAELPPLAVFPEWMKLATLSRIVLPVGWHWNESGYSDLYREANEDLDADALAALGIRWVVVTNLWSHSPSAAADRELADRSRFVPAGTFRSGDYYLSLFRAF